MSGAGAALQAALVAALKGDAIIGAAVSGIYDGVPARAAFPYLAVDGGQVLDWSVKGARGQGPGELVAVVVVDRCRSR